MRQKDNISLRDDAVALIYLAPFLVVFALFIGYPLFYSFWISLHRVTIYSDFFDIFGSMKWVGFGNYARVVQDPVFWWSIIITFFYAFLTIVGGIALSLTLALALRSNRPGFGIMRSGFFLPNVYDLYIVGVIWLLLYNPKGGPITKLLEFIQLNALAEDGVLNNPWLALPAIAFAMILKNAGFGMILFLTSLANINQSVFEAAEVDGANFWQKLRHVTLPLLKPIILFLSVTGMMGALNAFAEIFAMTDGRGGTSVQVAGHTLQAARISGFHLYKVFAESMYGEAAAISFLLLIVALFITYLNFKFLSPKD